MEGFVWRVGDVNLEMFHQLSSCVHLYIPAAVIFRYNVLSLVYLLLFIASLLLPGPQLKTQKGEARFLVSSSCNLKYMSMYGKGN